MIATKNLNIHPIKHPINLNDKTFIENKYEYYKWLRTEAPVYKGKVSIMSCYFLSRYEDCLSMLKDKRFVRNRSTATGSSRRTPIPVPKTVALMAQSMIIEDEPAHRRLRNLVHKAFTPRAIAKLGERIDVLTHQLLDQAEKEGEVDLQKAYALPIPVTVITEMVGVPDSDMPRFVGSMKTLTDGFSGLNLIRSFWNMRGLAKYLRQLIEDRRANPQDDILTGLIQAEEEGDKLTQDELISMIFLLIMAGYETTVHLITNSVLTLLQHPEQLALLRNQPELMESTIEEVLRYRGPVHGTKPSYAIEDITLHGVTIPKGSIVFPLLGSANHDETVFEDPETFRITRTPNKHFGFGQGIHYCLGAPLARLETKIALTNLFNRNPNLRLAVNPESLQLQQMPLWHRYGELPVILR